MARARCWKLAVGCLDRHVWCSPAPSPCLDRRYRKWLPDATTPIPQSSYGTQKLIGELLVADFARKGFIDGRVVRLPTVSIRPGKPNAAASSFASSILREPLNGQETVCPVEADAELWLISPRSAVDCLQHAFNLPNQKLGIGAINLPGITVTRDDSGSGTDRRLECIETNSLAT